MTMMRLMRMNQNQYVSGHKIRAAVAVELRRTVASNEQHLSHSSSCVIKYEVVQL